MASDSSKIQSLFLRDFMTIDFAWLHSEAGILGDSLHITAEIEGSTNSQGFIIDFGECKQLLKNLINKNVDHRCLVPTKSDSFEQLEAQDGEIAFNFKYGDKKKLTYHCPTDAVCFIPEKEIKLKHIARYIESIILKSLPITVNTMQISLREENQFEDFPNYHYTHGLRMHGGNCQRLIHGHRNKVEVLINGTNDMMMETEICEIFDRVHITAKGNVNNFTDSGLDIGVRNKSAKKNVEISYKSSQGSFYISIPASEVLVIEKEPSVENISEFIWSYIQRKYHLPIPDVRVNAYEGINKGAAFFGKKIRKGS